MIDFKMTEASANAKYEQVRDAIIQAIRDGKLGVLEKLPPISQIAEEAGVSLRTADLALKSLIDEGYCFRRPKKGTFVAAGNRMLKQAICGVLGTLDPIRFPLHALLYAGIMEASIRQNVPTLTIPLPSSETELDSPCRMIRDCDKSHEFDLKGVFIISSDYYRQGVELARTFPKKRFFLLNYEMDDLDRMPGNMAAVINDNYRGACRLAERVFSQYRPKTVTFLTLPLPEEGDITYLERERGIQDTAEAAGIKITPTLSTPGSGFSADQIDFAYESTLDFLKSQKTDFIFAANDQLALGAWKAIMELGLNEQTGIAGYDAINTLPGQDFPTARVPYTEMGRIGLAEMLNPKFRLPQVIKLQPEIIMHDGAGD